MFTTQISPEHLQLSQERTVVALALPAFQFQAATIQAVHVRLNCSVPLPLLAITKGPQLQCPEVQRLWKDAHLLDRRTMSQGHHDADVTHAVLAFCPG